MNENNNLEDREKEVMDRIEKIIKDNRDFSMNIAKIEIDSILKGDINGEK